MSVKETPRTSSKIHYPDSDGKPMADNTIQFKWISKLKGAIEYLFANDEDVFVAGDLLWYPVEGNPKIRIAPDVLVAFGRPKGDRGSYKQWEEGGIPPQVVMEVLSPSNTIGEMIDKQKFYHTYGVEEFYILDPMKEGLWMWQKEKEIAMLYPQQMTSCTSKRLGIQIKVEEGKLEVFYPDGAPILTYAETKKQAEEQRQLAEKQRQLAEEQRRFAEEHRRFAEEQRQLAEEQKRLTEQERKEKEAAFAEIERLKAELNKRKG